MMSKKVPELRFKGFTDDWEKRKLKDIAQFNPKTVLPDEFEYVDLESVVGTEMISHRTVSKEQAPSRAQRLAQKGDVFYQTVRPYQMNNYLYDLPYDNYVFSTGYAQMRPNIDSYFLLNSVQNKQFVQHVLERSTGTSYPAINSSDLSNIKIYVPVHKEEEQQKIGAFFKHLDDTIALHQRKLDLLKEQKKGFLQKMFPKNGAKVPELRFAGFADDWEERKLGEITTSYSGGTPSAGNSSYYKGDIPFIRSGEINSSKTELFLTEEGFNNSSAKLVEVGDILYALYGATSGEVGISQINGAINQAILAIKPIEGYESQFIMQWLKLQKQKIIDKYLQGGQGNLSGTIVKDLFLRIPDSKEQKKIGQFFKQLDDTIALHQRKLDLLKEQKKGFLQKMFV
ncbi:restriction endonuclease subunit S [Streptococcus thermophilus]|uniref:restriction endonuclease subunit S n=1 Tax=Streptococcus thermophilus TaxID=1308 RepID=UPI000A07D50B|nr:restriction endonuclease subunit S [Streptococcus thermophilus]